MVAVRWGQTLVLYPSSRSWYLYPMQIRRAGPCGDCEGGLQQLLGPRHEQKEQLVGETWASVACEDVCVCRGETTGDA